jgi:membrane protease YdiL (CAAX protease family)
LENCPTRQKENKVNAITSFIKRYPQGVFWGIACITFFLAAFLQGIGLWGLLIYGTFLGGALVTGVVDGRSGLKTYFSRIVRWRVGLKWYAVALLLPPVLYLLAFGLNILAAFFWPGLLAIALAEEPGFRGFALPRFLEGRSALAAALIVGGLHAFWHLPFYVGMLSEGYIIGIVTTILVIVSGSVFFTWLFNNTNGSVLIAMLLHASVDLFAGDSAPLTFGPLYSGFSAADLVRQDIFQAVAFVAMAIILIIVMGRELGRKPETTIGAMAAVQPLAGD